MPDASLPAESVPGLDLLWFCQLAADGEFIGSGPMRRPTLPYLSSLVETAAEMGFSSLLTATNFHAENDAWTASVATLARTERAGLLIAVRPGMFNPAVFAKMAATAATLFPGRVRINVVTGSNPAENAMYGDHETHDMRYSRTHEWIALMRRLWTEPVVDHKGTFYECQGAKLEPKPNPSIPVYLGGHSEAAQKLAAELADVYLVWADTLDGIRARLASMRKAETAAGRRVPHGMRCHVIVRETEAEAWAACRPADQPRRSGGARRVRRRRESHRLGRTAPADRAFDRSIARRGRESLGRRGSCAHWCRTRDRRQSGTGRGKVARLSCTRRLDVYSVRLSTPRGVSPLRRARDAASARVYGDARATPIKARAEFARSEGVAPVT